MKELLPASIVQNTYSAADLYRRADILQRFLEHFFFEPAAIKGSRTDLIVAYYHDSDAETVGHAAAVAAWGDAVLDAYTADNLYKRTEELKHAVRSFPRLTLYIPVRFSAVQIERIGQWCRTQIQEDIMLDLKIDAGAVGGCAFAFNNAFHDVSFSYYSNKERPAIVSLVRNYGN